MGRKRTAEEKERDAQWWAARGCSLGNCDNNYWQGHHPSLEALDRQGTGRAFSLDHSTGLLTMDWRRP